MRHGTERCVRREIDANAMDLMRATKGQLDPNGILNPDKMLPPLTAPG